MFLLCSAGGFCLSSTVSSLNFSGDWEMNVSALSPNALFGWPTSFGFSDGTTLRSGAGNGSGVQLFPFASEQTVGNTTYFALNVPVGSQVLSFYNFGSIDFPPFSFDTQGTFVSVAPLILSVDNSAPSVGIVSGLLQLTSNQIAGDSSFVPFSSDVGTLVRFEMTTILQNETWHIGMQNDTFDFSFVGSIDLAPVSSPEPQVASLFTLGCCLFLVAAVARRRTRQH
jgi:hypothetical protein